MYLVCLTHSFGSLCLSSGRVLFYNSVSYGKLMEIVPGGWVPFFFFFLFWPHCSIGTSWAGESDLSHSCGLHCSCGVGHGCGLDLIPGPGNTYATGVAEKEKKKKSPEFLV